MNLSLFTVLYLGLFNDVNSLYDLLISFETENTTYKTFIGRKKRKFPFNYCYFCLFKPKTAENCFLLNFYFISSSFKALKAFNNSTQFVLNTLTITTKSSN